MARGQMFTGRPAGEVSTMPVPQATAGLIYTGITQFDSSTDSKNRSVEIRFNSGEVIANACVAVVSPGGSSNAEMTQIRAGVVNGSVCTLIVTIQSNDGNAVTAGTMCAYTVVMEPM